MEKKLSCSKCGSLVSEGDSFCGNCGNKLVHEEKKEKVEKVEKVEKTKKHDDEKSKYAQDLIIECEGNKFKAIKEFKAKFDSDNDEATKYIDLAYNKFSDVEIVEEDVKEEITEDIMIEEIVKENDYSLLASTKALGEAFGYSFLEAKVKYDEVIEKKKLKEKEEQTKKEEKVVNLPSDEEVQKILIKNDGSLLNSINEIKATYNCSFMEAKALVDKNIN